MSQPIIVYHDNCHDGITALWCALQAYPGAEPYAGIHGQEPDLERLRDRDVIVVDFSWKRYDMFRLLGACKSLVVLDHHKSAEADLAGLEDVIPGRARVVFDMNRSGAGLAWDELVGGKRPLLVDYVEDRDLFRFALPHSREIHAACASYPLTLECRDDLFERQRSDLLREGRSILRYHKQLVAEALKNVRRGFFAGRDVPILACPTIALVSDLGAAMCQGELFAVVYVERPDGSTYYSLRSDANGMDVSVLATSLGGGGHMRAAGVTQAPGGPTPLRVVK